MILMEVHGSPGFRWFWAKPCTKSSYETARLEWSTKVPSYRVSLGLTMLNPLDTKQPGFVPGARTTSWLMFPQFLGFFIICSSFSNIAIQSLVFVHPGLAIIGTSLVERHAVSLPPPGSHSAMQRWNFMHSFQHESTLHSLLHASIEWVRPESKCSQWASVSSFTLFHTFHSLNLDF